MNEQIITGSGRKKQEVFGTVSTTVDTTGLATSAKQDTIIGHLDGVETTLTAIDGRVDGVEGLLTTIDTDTGTLAGAVTGGQVQVDIAAVSTSLFVEQNTASALNATVHGDVGVIDQLDLTNSNPAAVAIVDGDGTQITSFGGGTQYTQGDTDASITGTAMMMEGAADTLLPVQGTVADGLLVNLGGNNDVTVTGTVTANLAAGTNNIGDVDILSIAAGDNNIGNVDVASLPGDVEADIDQIRDQIDLITPDIEEIRVDADAIRVATELLDDSVATLGTTTYTEATTKGITIGAVRRDADTSLVNTTNEIAPLIVDANGYLKVEIFDGGGTHTVDIASGGVASGGFSSGSIASGAIASGAIASGAIATGAIAAGTASIAQTEDTAHSSTEHLVKIGARRIDTAAVSSDTSGDWSTVNQSAEGAQWSTLTPTTTSGLSVLNSTSSDGGTALTNSAQAIKASAGNLYGYYIYNPNASAAAFIQFYNTASGSVTVGTTNPLFMLTIPAGSAANLMFPYPVSFSTAISWAATSTAGGNGALGTACDAVAWYK